MTSAEISAHGPGDLMDDFCRVFELMWTTSSNLYINANDFVFNTKQRLTTILGELPNTATAKELLVQAVTSKVDLNAKDHKFLSKYYSGLTLCFLGFAIANFIGFWFSPLLSLFLTKNEAVLANILLLITAGNYLKQNFLKSPSEKRITAFFTACFFGLLLGFKLYDLQLQFYIPPVIFFTIAATVTSHFLLPMKRLEYLYMIGAMAGIVHLFYGLLLNGFSFGYFFWTLVVAGFLTVDLQIKLKLLNTAERGLISQFTATIVTISTYALVYGFLYFIMSSGRISSNVIVPPAQVHAASAIPTKDDTTS